MAEHKERKVWSEETERRITWFVLAILALAVLFVVLAYWRLRG